jgi:hypothetical protein
MARPPRARRALTLAAASALLALLVLAAGSPARSARPYTATPGPQRTDARFVVTYTGSGTYRTVFHATPPNPGGKPDTNDAHDSSSQMWAIRFRRALTIPACGPPPDGSADPCASIAGLSGATGTTRMTGRVDHRHVDGLYRQLDRTVKCTLQKKTPGPKLLQAEIRVRYLPDSRSIAITATDPIETTVSLFPAQCPKQGDSIDRIADFYAMPGFSFKQGYGPDRWFTSREVVVPAAVFHHSAKVTIPLRLTPTGTPPRHCHVNDPSFERCTTGGAWNGVLTLTARPATR